MNAAATSRRARPVLDSERRRRSIVTPEGVSLAFTVASRASRAGALMIDLGMIFAAMLVTTLLLAYLLFGVIEVPQSALDGSEGKGSSALQFLAVLWIVAMFLFRNAWFLAYELGPRGATPGKRLAGIRVASRDGGQLTAEAVIARNLLRDIELFLPLLFFAQASAGGDVETATIAGLVWVLAFLAIPLINRDHLRAGDIVAGSWVVEAPKARLASLLASGAAAREGTSPVTGARFRFGDTELGAYGEYELQVLERVLRDGRADNLVAVAQAICAKIGWEPGGGDERAFLEAYYTQLRARLEQNMRFGKRKADKFAGES
ncbi:MAG TPA: RDD family protein [Novosphingobium sp.]|nr:RDD family protein [Novosphingobium sp.]